MMAFPTRWRALAAASAVALVLCIVLLPSANFSASTSTRRLTLVRQGPSSISEGFSQPSPEHELSANQCPPLPTRPAATSVRNLAPGDVRVMAAIGDSITAAFAAKGYLPLEFRGLSFPIGGEHGYTTLPNLFAQHTGKLPIGAATGSTDPLRDASDIFGPEPLGPVPADVAHLNAGISNAKSNAGPKQVAWLAKVMKDYESKGLISMQKDWKLITLTLGANDLRAVCRGNASAEQVAAGFKDKMNQTLVALRQNFTRVFVSLVAVPPVGDMAKFTHATKVCKLVQTKIEKGQCPQGGESTRVQVAMNAALKELQTYWTDTLKAEDFAVVYHSFFEHCDMPNVSYLSEVDCFHPGYKGHAALATSLWNSLLTPRKQKSTNMSVGETPLCPGKDTLLYID